jgi:hypothetical protein
VNDRGGGPRFLEERALVRGVEGDLHDLDRHVAIELFVACAVDRSHAPFAEERSEHVSAAADGAIAFDGPA